MMRHGYVTMLTALVVCAGLHSSAAAQATACEALEKLEIPATRIVHATTIQPAPTWTYPTQMNGKNIEVRRPFCRVEAMVNGNIGVEVWMPLNGWNHRFLGNGNGAYAGFINAVQLEGGLARGYAAASTDGGHREDAHESAWALHHPELIKDFGYRAQHAMAEVSKQVVKAFYAQPLKSSFYLGCSGGGHQGLTEAQRYPNDYDGIVVGAPGIYFPRLAVRSFYMMWSTQRIEGGTLTHAQSVAAQSAAIKACDTKDGVRDGIIDDPRKCSFDYAQLACSANANTEGCLSDPQVKALKVLAGPVKETDGSLVYPAFAPGTLLLDPAVPPATGKVGLGFMQNFVMDDPAWDGSQFNLDRDFATVEKKVGSSLDSDNPDLRPFFNHGGKLMVYHGWSDGAVSPFTTLQYLSEVEKTSGAALTAASSRVYMVPGMEHCGGGEGTGIFGTTQSLDDTFSVDADHDLLRSMEQWVDQGHAPGAIIAGHRTDGKLDRTRPLCPFPQVSTYKGKGVSTDASNYECVKP